MEKGHSKRYAGLILTLINQDNTILEANTLYGRYEKQ